MQVLEVSMSGNAAIQNVSLVSAPMQMTDFLPSPALNAFIRSYKVIESDAGTTNTVLPNNGIALAFRFRGQISYVNGPCIQPLPLFAISGLRKTVRFINYRPQSACIIVVFRETGAAAFFRQPLHELYEESVSLDHFLPVHLLEPLEEMLTLASDHLRRIAILENFLLKIIRYPAPDELLLRAVQTIRTSGGNIRIKNLADSLFISHDAFEKRFRKAVGTSPKQYANLIRLQALTKQLGRAPRFSDLALDAGYFDQSHFNNDFKLFTGYTPSEFSRLKSFW